MSCLFPFKPTLLRQVKERELLRSKIEGRKCVTISPDIRIAAWHIYTKRIQLPLRREFVGCSYATLEDLKSEFLSIKEAAARARAKKIQDRIDRKSSKKEPPI